MRENEEGRYDEYDIKKQVNILFHEVPKFFQG